MRRPAAAAASLVPAGLPCALIYCVLGDASRWLRPRIQQAAAQLTAQQRSVLEWGSAAFSAAVHQRPAHQRSPFWLPSCAETLLSHPHRIPLNAGQRKLLQDEELLSAAGTGADAATAAKSSSAASAATSAGTKATSELQQGMMEALLCGMWCILMQSCC